MGEHLRWKPFGPSGVGILSHLRWTTFWRLWKLINFGIWKPLGKHFLAFCMPFWLPGSIFPVLETIFCLVEIVEIENGSPVDWELGQPED